MRRPALPYPLPDLELRLTLAQTNNQTLAAQWGVSESTVARWRRALGITPLPKHRPRKGLPQPLWQLREDLQRMPLRRVARKYGVGATTAWRWAQQLQVTRPEFRGKRTYGSRGECDADHTT